MADQRIQYTERMTGNGHPSLPDTLNRLTLVEHTSEGLHTGLSVANPENTLLGFDAGSSLAKTAGGTCNTFVGVKVGQTGTFYGGKNTFIGHFAGRHAAGQFNVLMGYQAGLGVNGLTRGTYNIFVGARAGKNIRNGEFNTFIGGQAGENIIDAKNNSLMGYKAGVANSRGNDNVFIGYKAGGTDNGGGQNVFIGKEAGFQNTLGSNNTFIGKQAGYSNTIGSCNIFVGNEAGYSNIVNGNIFIGFHAGRLNTSGLQNTFIGNLAGKNNVNGGYNTFIGNQAGYSNTKGKVNTFVGEGAGYLNTLGSRNTFIGETAGYSNTIGVENVFIGENCGYSNISGSSNVFIGKSAGYFTTGNQNVFIGFDAGYNETGNNKLYIENTKSTTPLIYGEFDNNKIKINGALTVSGTSTFQNKVAIGSGTTNAKLAVYTGEAAGNAANTLRIQSSAVGVALDLYCEDVTSTNRNWRIGANNQNRGDLEFLYSAAQGEAPSNYAMSINSSGRVKSSNALTVSGTSTFQGGVGVSSGTAYGLIQTLNSTGLKLLNSAGNGIAVNQNNRIGIGIDNPDTTLHLYTASAGAVSAASGAVLTLENSGNTALQFLTPNTGAGDFYFGDPEVNTQGVFRFDHATNNFKFSVDGGVSYPVSINSSGQLVLILTGTPPFSISGTNVINNLNAKMYDGLKKKIIEIGNWNMDTTASVTIAHGLTLANIRSTDVSIYNDGKLTLYSFYGQSMDAGENWIIDSTNIQLTRTTSGGFDNTNFDGTANRGFIIIEYVG